jgi:hypothetical protein
MIPSFASLLPELRRRNIDVVNTSIGLGAARERLP